jgi:hypothetical protein
MKLLILKTFVVMTVACTIYSFIYSILRDRKIREVSNWVKQTYPEVWNSLPWGLRNLVRYAALMRITDFQLINDKNYDERYAIVQRYNRLMFSGIGIGLCIFVLMLIISYK